MVDQRAASSAAQWDVLLAAVRVPQWVDDWAGQMVRTKVEK